jgi:hypothetical protein
LPSLLPLGVIALVLLLFVPSDAVHRPTTPVVAASPPPALPLLESPPLLASVAASPLRSPLFDDLVGSPPPTAVTDSAPAPRAEERRLLDAVGAALPALGGTSEAGWGPPTAVGPILVVRWAPGVALPDAHEVQEAVVAAVGTVVAAMDRAFPSGFRGSQGAPLAAVRVDLPDKDSVLVAVRSYRDLATGSATADEFASQWRLLGRGEAAASASPAAVARPPRLVPVADTVGAPQRWPPRIARFYGEVLEAARVYQIDPDLLAAIMQQESGGEPEAVGAWAWIPHMGRYERAIGLMQVMPNEAERRGVAIADAWEPQANILLGARVLRDKLTVLGGDFWTRVQGYYGFGDPLSDYWLNRVYANWLAFRDDRSP